MASCRKQVPRPFFALKMNLQDHLGLEAGPGVMPANQLPKWAAPRVLQKACGHRVWSKAIGLVQSKIQINGSDAASIISRKMQDIRPVQQGMWAG